MKIINSTVAYVQQGCHLNFFSLPNARHRKLPNCQATIFTAKRLAKRQQNAKMSNTNSHSRVTFKYANFDLFGSEKCPTDDHNVWQTCHSGTKLYRSVAVANSHLISCRLTLPIGCTSIDLPKNLVFTCISAHHIYTLVHMSMKMTEEQCNFHN